MTLASLLDTKPLQRVSILLEDDAEFTCSGGDVLIMGVMLPKRPSRGTKRSIASANASSGESKPADVPKEAPAPKRAIAKVMPAKAPSAAELAAAAEAKKKAMQAEKPSVAHRVLRSGLAYDVLKMGDGAIAGRAKSVRVRYEGWLKDTMKSFDSGVITFRLGIGEVIRGWDEGIEGMLVGEHRRLYVPSRLGYGKAGFGKAIPPHADLIFEVELLK
jgi:FKBP-type peptidyl-prolyl cis-trans isomerase